MQEQDRGFLLPSSSKDFIKIWIERQPQDIYMIVLRVGLD